MWARYYRCLGLCLCCESMLTHFIESQLEPGLKTIHCDHYTFQNKSGSCYENGASKTKWRSKQINMQRNRQTKRKQCTQSNMGNVGLVCVLLSCTLFNQLIYQHFSLFMFDKEKNKTRSRTVRLLEGREFPFHLVCASANLHGYKLGIQIQISSF